MKKTFMTLCLVSVSLLSYSQVGISTSNPQGTLHVDGAKDNPDTGVPNASQQSNDFTVTNLGRVGIGTINPAGRWHLYNPINGTETGNDYLIDDESPISQTPGLVMRRSNAGGNLAQNDLIGAMLFNPKINGGFSFGGAGISGIYRGDGTTFLTALAFRINNNLEAGRFAENGFMGIGTTDPKQQLHIVQSGTTSGITTSFISGLTITGNGAGPGSGFTGPGFYLENTNAAAGSKLLKINYTINNTESMLNFQNVTDNASSTGATTLVLTRSGKLGILNVNPASNLSVSGNAAIGNGYVGTAAPTNGAIIQGDVGIGTLTPSAKLSVSGSGAGTIPILSLTNTAVTGNPTLNIYPGYTSTGTAIVQGNQYAVVFDQDPGVTSGTNQSLYDFHGQVRYVNASAFSDRRLKKDIINLNEYGLAEVMKIQPKRYILKESDTPDVGLIAQELRAIVPEIVYGDEEKGLLSVDYAKISLVLINAIKEQQKMIETLQSEVKSLKLKD